MPIIEKKYFYLFCIFSLFITFPQFLEIPSLWRGDTHSFLAMGCNSYRWFLTGVIDYQPLRPPFYSAFINFFLGIWSIDACREIGRDPLSFTGNIDNLRNFGFVTFIQYLLYLSSSLFFIYSLLNLLKIKSNLQKIIFYFLSGFLIYYPGFILETRGLLPESIQVSISFLVCALVLLSVNLRKNKKNDYEKSISEAALIFIVSGLIFSFSFLIRPTLIFVTFVPFLISFINIFYYLINSKNYFLSLSKKLPLLKNFFSRTAAFSLVFIFSFLQIFSIIHYKNKVSEYVGYSTISPLGDYVSGSAIYDNLSLIREENEWLRSILENSKKTNGRGHYVWSSWGAINDKTCNDPEIRNKYGNIKDCTLIGAKVLKEEVLNIYKKQPLQVLTNIYRSENWKLFNPPYNPSIRLEKPYIFHNFADPRPNPKRPNPISIYSQFQLTRFLKTYYDFFWEFLLTSNLIINIFLISRILITKQLKIVGIYSLTLYCSIIAYVGITMIYGCYESHYSGPIVAPLTLTLLLSLLSFLNEYKFRNIK